MRTEELCPVRPIASLDQHPDSKEAHQTSLGSRTSGKNCFSDHAPQQLILGGMLLVLFFLYHSHSRCSADSENNTPFRSSIRSWPVLLIPSSSDAIDFRCHCTKIIGQMKTFCFALGHCSTSLPGTASRCQESHGDWKCDISPHVPNCPLGRNMSSSMQCLEIKVSCREGYSYCTPYHKNL